MSLGHVSFQKPHVDFPASVVEIFGRRRCPSVSGSPSMLFESNNLPKGWTILAITYQLCVPHAFCLPPMANEAINEAF